VAKQRVTVEDVSEGGGSRPPPSPAIVLVAAGTTPAHRAIAAGAGEVTLGRRVIDAGEAFDIDDERLSREHATVARRGGEWRIRDLDSRNGTFVDGERITGEVVRRGDVVLRLAHAVFVLLADGRDHGRPPADDGEAVIGPELARALDQVRRAAASPSLLVHGESGSGKELAARLYHQAGPRAAGPFVAVNCAAIPEGVAERLMFGARKGAFSGAVADATGYLSAADGGTLFLDEIAELDPAVQAKLLRALETREVVPVGATTGTRVDVGVVAASHHELAAAVAARRFRDDLYYRLARSVVTLPPLRQRKADIPRLVMRALAAGAPALAAHARLIEACCVRPWPGNVRELHQAIVEAAATARAEHRDVVRPEDLRAGAGLALDAARPARPARRPPRPPRPGPPLVTPDLDRDAVVAALAAAGNNISAAARALGVHRTQLYRLMQRHGLVRDE
jgi:transcriptional regulator with PAS, ATPase and Fis domain